MKAVRRTQILLRENQTPVVVMVAVFLATGFGALNATHSRVGVLIGLVIVGTATLLLITTLDLAVGLLILLTICTLIDRFTLPTGRLAIRAEQIAVIAALVVMAIAYRGHAPKTLLKPTVAEALLLVWLFVALASSLFVAPVRTTSLKQVALVAICTSAMFVPRRLLRSELIEPVTRWFLILLLLEAAYGLGAWLMNIGGGSISSSLNRGHLSAYGTLWEPNVFGAVCAAAAIAWLLVGHRFYRWSWAAVAVCVGASTVSFTRTAWMAGLVITAMILLTSLRRLLDPSTVAVAGLASVALVGGILVIDHLGDYWPAAAPQHSGGAAADITKNVADPVDITGRLHQVSPVLSDLRSHPVFGGGLNSLGQRHTDPGLAHIGNLELLVLNDTGLVGLAVFALFGITVLVGAWRRRADPFVVGLAGMTLVVGITNQATETTELMFTWLFLGLVLAVAELGSGVGARTSTHLDLVPPERALRRDAA